MKDKIIPDENGPDGEELTASLVHAVGTLGALLLSQNLVTPDQLQKALHEQEETTERLGQLLVRKGYVSEDLVYSSLAAQLGLEYRRFEPSAFDPKIVRILPEKFSKQFRVVPLSVNDSELEVGMEDPSNLNVIDMLLGFLKDHGLKLRPVLMSPSSVREGLAAAFESDWLTDSDRVTTVKSNRNDFDLVTGEDLPKIRRVVNQVLYRAVEEGASDIHIENLREQVRVRFRIDGLLQERLTPLNKDTIGQIVSVLKIDSQLDITEHRRSQDGVFQRQVGEERQIDFRINVHSTEYGPDAVIRILDRSRSLVPLEDLGFPEGMLRDYLRVTENPQGLILMSGPTGSGKTTTIYSTLQSLNRPEKKIVTAEEPIEYQLNGINQYQVNEAIGNTFAEYARRFLRKDPDIILIGEIRDEQTALSCLKAAMTGHLVFSTLHTNDSIGVVARLRGLGIDSSSIASAILAVTSQRLARRICQHCLETDQPSSELIEEFYGERTPPKPTVFKKAQGCDKCVGTGYRGRIGLYEFWAPEMKTQRLITGGADDELIREASLEAGLRPLLADAIEKAESGVTTLEELRRVIPLDQIRRYSSLDPTTMG